jgi:hypothetical protein
MATRPCPHCAEKIQNAAKICRHCKQAVEPVKGLSFIEGIGAVIGVVILGAIGAGVVSGSSTPKPPAAFPAAPGVGGPPAQPATLATLAEGVYGERGSDWPALRDAHHALVVSAHDMAAAYRSNELKADAKYKGQIVSMTGRVVNIERTMGTLIAHVGDRYNAAMVEVRPDQEKELGQVDSGDVVTVEGWGAGATVLNSPHITGAHVTNVSRRRHSDDE